VIWIEHLYDWVMSMTALETTQQRLQDRIAQICGHLNVLHAELVTLTAQAIETNAWCGAGIQTPQHWVAWQTGVSPERAKQIVHIAERSTELPSTFAAFTEGVLSIDQVAVVTKRTPAHNDTQACELAKCATVAQLRVGLSKHFFPPTPKPDNQQPPPPEPAPQHQLCAGFNNDGDFFLHGLANSTDGALIHNALREAKDALFQAGNTQASWLDALVEVCKRSIGTITSASRRDAYKIVVHLDTNGAWVHQGPVVPPTVFEHITCDGHIQPLWIQNGSPINMGRLRHIVPLRTRIVIENRDRICRHPTCHSTNGLEVHHIIHWLHGGTTNTTNLCCLCSKHHHAHHNDEFTITGNADQTNGLTFRDKHQHIIKSCGKPEPPGNNPPPEAAKPYIHPTGETLQTKWLNFTPPPTPQPPTAADN
jgi:hypothetical protein